ncbi:MAG: hypothetical protein Ct9H300mP26_5300 [Acidimicrobiales bacterium]|nr:MAG: hypothetical protein Ct9H300mP26_5300 [Acidimicrobiales bacterium]
MPQIVAYVPNLMDRGRFGDSVQFVQSLEELRAVDAALGFRRSVTIASPRTSPFAVTSNRFRPHIDTETLDAAKAAGCTEALPRSIFFKRLPNSSGGTP